MTGSVETGLGHDGRKRAALLLTLVIAASVLFRVATAVILGDSVGRLPGIYDQRSYHALAERLLAGHGFSFGVDWWPATRAGEPTAHWSYLYSVYLAGVYGLFGPHPLVPRLVQALLAGVLQPYLTWRIGRRAFGVSSGLVAAALVAVYAYFVYYAGALMTEIFYVLAILWVLDLATGAVPLAEGRYEWILMGVALGAAALLRQVILLFAPFLFAWLWWQRGGCRNWRSTIEGFLVAGIAGAVIIAPWTVRNYLAFGRFVLLNTNAGFAFFWANHPIHGTSFMSILPADAPSYQELIPPALRHLDEAALDQALLREGLRSVVQDPWRYFLLSVSRLKDYFEFWPTAQSSLVSNISRVGSFGISFPFMLYGLWLSATSRWSRETNGQRGTVVLLWLFVGIYSVVHLLSWALVRYRLPVDAVLVVFAGLSAGRAWDGLRALVRRSRPVTSL